MKPQEVIRLIEQAWRGESYPGDEKLIPRPEQPPGACRDEHDYVAAYFKGKPWRGLESWKKER